MSDTRETIKITTPVKKHKVVLKAWINGREKQKIDGAMFNSITTEGEGASLKPVMNDTMLASQENARIEAVVVSIDGSEENILDTVLDMRVKAFEFVAEQAQKIVDGELDEKKEKPSKINTIEP